MEIPKTFRPNKNSDETLEKILNYEAEIKEEERKCKREISVDLCTSNSFEGDTIYVKIDFTKDFNYYRLEIASDDEFYFPVSYNKIDWGERKRVRGTSFLRTESEILQYLKLLEEGNDAVLYWHDNEYISKLKRKFKKRYKFTIKKTFKP